ncbi:MAG: phosphopyruvate hydratase [Patescibacteria group bacterium]
MKIIDANLKIIKDSRGKDTLEAELISEDFSAKASVPAGKSVGTHEAFVLEPKLALKKFEEIKSQILAASASGRIETQEDLDNFLIALDGTSSTSSGQAKSNLGGNLILALSLAWARLRARFEGLELFEYISQMSKVNGQMLNWPRPIFNVINGGAHAAHQESKLSFQEFQVIPEADDFNLGFSLGKIFYRKLGDYLREKFGKENVVLGDEAGYSAPFKNNEEAIECIAEVIEKYKHPLRIGLDVAASQFFKEDHYLIGGKKYSSDELREYYLRLIETHNIISIEDPFCEEAFDDFSALSNRIAANKKEILIIADDLTTTNSERLKTAIAQKSGNAILIKPNQIGTLTETLKVVKLAYENNWQTIVSHRSVETLDDFIADLAVGVGAWGIKAGAPANPERLAKYERLLKINNLKLKI